MKKTVIAAAAAVAHGSGLYAGSDSPSGTASAPSTVKTDAAALGDVQLTVWDQVRGGRRPRWPS